MGRAYQCFHALGMRPRVFSVRIAARHKLSQLWPFWQPHACRPRTICHQRHVREHRETWKDTKHSPRPSAFHALETLKGADHFTICCVPRKGNVDRRQSLYDLLPSGPARELWGPPSNAKTIFLTESDIGRVRMSPGVQILWDCRHILAGLACVDGQPGFRPAARALSPNATGSVPKCSGQGRKCACTLREQQDTRARSQGTAGGVLGRSGHSRTPACVLRAQQEVPACSGHSGKCACVL